MSAKLFHNLQDFIHMYNQAGTATIQHFPTLDVSHVTNNNISKSPPLAVHIPQSKGNPPAPNGRDPQCSRAVSPTTSILCQRTKEKCSLKKSVSFPDESRLVSGYYEPRKSKFDCKNVGETSVDIRHMYNSYLQACKKHNVNPSIKIEKQISGWHSNASERQETLNLKGEKMSHEHVECLEEIFKRIQFVSLDFEYSFLDDETLTCLADMIEFYDSCYRLNLSFNQHIGLRGWQSLFKTVRKTPCLEQLNLRYTSLNERCVPILARTLRQGCALKVLHLENCSLTGKPLLLLACALKSNDTVKEIYLGENNLNPNDANHIQQLINGSTSLRLIDVRNNQLQDMGAMRIFEALRSAQCNSHASLDTLVMWNNRITAHSMSTLAASLTENKTLTTLNLGANNIHSDGIARLKESLARNRTILRLGLQATKLNCQGAIAIAECIADNPMLIRVDLRDNPDIKSAGLLALHLAMKMNTSITTLNLDKSCCSNTSALKVLHKMKDYGDQFRQLYLELEEFCERNRKLYMKSLQDNESDQVTCGIVPCSLVGDKNVLPVEEDTSGVPGVPHPPPTPPTNTIRVKPCVFHRQPSLTCSESVEDAEQRMEDMPRVDVDEIVIEGEQEEEPHPPHPPLPPLPPFELCKPNRALNLAQPPVIHTPMVCVSNDRAKKKKKRFEVTSVTTDDIMTTRTIQRERSRSISLNEAKHVMILASEVGNVNGDTVKEMIREVEVNEAVQSVINDLVTFTEYEIGQHAHTPSAKKTRAQLVDQFNHASQLTKLKWDEDEGVEECVETVVRDLVKMCIVGERDSIRLALSQRRKKINENTFVAPPLSELELFGS